MVDEYREVRRELPLEPLAHTRARTHTHTHTTCSASWRVVSQLLHGCGLYGCGRRSQQELTEIYLRFHICSGPVVSPRARRRGGGTSLLRARPCGRHGPAWSAPSMPSPSAKQGCCSARGVRSGLACWLSTGAPMPRASRQLLDAINRSDSPHAASAVCVLYALSECWALGGWGVCALVFAPVFAPRPSKACGGRRRLHSRRVAAQEGWRGG
jgi:hypothetical protein